VFVPQKRASGCLLSRRRLEGRESKDHQLAGQYNVDEKAKEVNDGPHHGLYDKRKEGRRTKAGGWKNDCSKNPV